MSAIHRSILIGRFLLAGWIGSLIPLAAEPVSSAGYGEALRMAEQIAAQDPSWRVFGCEGASMGDFYGSHSLLLVKEARLHEVREGMMVVYRGREGLLIAHKVIAHHGSWLRTQGVMNERPDPVYVRADMVVGTVFGVLHTNGDRSGALESKDGRLLPTAYCRRY